MGVVSLEEPVVVPLVDFHAWQHDGSFMQVRGFLLDGWLSQFARTIRK